MFGLGTYTGYGGDVKEMVFLSGQNPNIYTANYNDPENSKAFRDFKADMSRHLKLLYCIDMLNEGVHVDDIDGVILLRPTVSPIIYMQQIGRCLSAGNTQTPDWVDNFESLYSIEVLRDESKSSIISTCSSYHISEIIALTIFPTRLRAIRSIRVTLSRRIIS